MNVQDGVIWIVFANHINCHSVQNSKFVGICCSRSGFSDISDLQDNFLW